MPLGQRMGRGEIMCFAYKGRKTFPTQLIRQTIVKKLK